jgi:hypothetical protein
MYDIEEYNLKTKSDFLFLEKCTLNFDKLIDFERNEVCEIHKNQTFIEKKYTIKLEDNIFYENVKKCYNNKNSIKNIFIKDDVILIEFFDYVINIFIV